MTKVSKSALIGGRTLSYSVDPDFHDYELRYPLRGISNCHYEAKATRRGGYPHVDYCLKAKLCLEDSRDGALFSKDIKLTDSVDILDKEDDIGEGYVLPGPSIDLDLVALSIIVSSLPIRVVRSNSELPKSGEGYHVYREDDYLSLAEEKKDSSPFDVLSDIDLSK